MTVTSLAKQEISMTVDYEYRRKFEAGFIHKIPTIRGKDIYGCDVLLNTDNIVAMTFLNLGSPEPHTQL